VVVATNHPQRADTEAPLDSYCGPCRHPVTARVESFDELEDLVEGRHHRSNLALRGGAS